MGKDLRTLIHAFRMMAEVYQTVAVQVDGESGELAMTAGDLKKCTDDLEKYLAESHSEVLPEKNELKPVFLATLAREVRRSLSGLRIALFTLLRERPANLETRRFLLTQSHQNVIRLLDLMSDKAFPTQQSSGGRTRRVC